MIWQNTGRTLLAMTDSSSVRGCSFANFTPDWISARTSVQSLAALTPDVVVTGHGQAMQGQEMRAALHELAERFDEIAVPQTGRYTIKQD